LELPAAGAPAKRKRQVTAGIENLSVWLGDVSVGALLSFVFVELIFYYVLRAVAKFKAPLLLSQAKVTMRTCQHFF
jgi:hypothetical protein